MERTLMVRGHGPRILKEVSLSIWMVSSFWAIYIYTHIYIYIGSIRSYLGPVDKDGSVAGLVQK